ncbi:hypothetical protein ACJIZ3_002801 [Penstemon smallii]|uniref:Uncharacterized protein n=1 Tax=Penstemon smallii TaxID=265156 RepID=A0ABD3UA93_9LAMI
MGLFKRLAGLLGFSRDDDHHHHHEQEDYPADGSIPSPSTSSGAAPAQHLPRKGFSVQVPVERTPPPPPPPLLLPCADGDGGVQGLKWYAKRLRIDEDGDIADEFLEEVVSNTSINSEEHNRSFPRFEVKYSSRPAKVKNQALFPNGRIQHQVECQPGRLEWL